MGAAHQDRFGHRSAPWICGDSLQGGPDRAIGDDCTFTSPHYIVSDIRSGVKPVAFMGSSLDDLRAFPATARRQAGHQLDRVQRGLDPDDWRPMPSIGMGVREIRVREAAGAFRVIYMAAFADAIYVLHAFQKKTRRTAKRDLDLAESRLREVTTRDR